jgi:GNAT superfamily N-acetyltransferase
MPDPERNRLFYEGFILEPLTTDLFPLDFDCSDPDLNEFFQQDVLAHEAELYTRTYVLRYLDIETGEKLLPVAALISYCNDAVRLKDFRNHLDELPEEKRYPSIPAVKIARLGVQKMFQGDGIGSLLLNLTKVLFVTNNRTGCRLVTVDAYNHPKVLNFYRRENFDFIRDKDATRPTRIMFYDLTRTPEDEIKAVSSSIKII